MAPKGDATDAANMGAMTVWRNGKGARVLLDLVHWEIEHSRFPLSERIRMLKHIRAKLLRAAPKVRRGEEDKPRQRR
jgi:hypothetical protein